MIARLFEHLRLALGLGRFRTSTDYWEDRYRRGGDSGGGSYGDLARFKADVLNAFVERHAVRSVVEFGCGDGSQLGLVRYPSYLGVDASAEAVRICRDKYAADATKRFATLAEYDGAKADMALSLDVIYHLVEDAVFEAHIRSVFAAGERWVAVYSTDTDEQKPLQSPHVRHRRFTERVAATQPGWTLRETVPNAHPKLSQASFFFYERT